MGMVVQHNMTAQNANRQLGITTGSLAKSTEKLSSGYRINRAADDAAGLAISEKLRNQVKGLTQASDNAQNGISLIQTAEGALNEVHSMLQRMSQLAVQAANDTNTSSDRMQIQKEVSQLGSEISRIATTTQFNTKNLLTGEFDSTGSGTSLVFHIGANTNQTISVDISATDASTLGVASLNVSTQANAEQAISTAQLAIEDISSIRSKLGAIQNRLEHTIANLDTNAENTDAAESRIRDVDMAREMVSYSKNNILMQAGQSMLAQANSQTQGVVNLLQ